MGLVMGPLLLLMMLMTTAHVLGLEKRMSTTTHIERMELETTASKRGGSEWRCSSTEKGSEKIFRVNFGTKRTSTTGEGTLSRRSCIRPESVIMGSFIAIAKDSKSPTNGLKDLVSTRCPVLVRMELQC